MLNVFGLNSFLAHALSRHWNIPLSLILYDRWEVWVKPWVERCYLRNGWARRILNHASRIWTVSPELASCYKLEKGGRVSILRPIPEGLAQCRVEWRDAFRQPTIAYAGAFHDHQAAQFRLVAHFLADDQGTLLIVSDRIDRIRQFLGAISNVEYHLRFPSNAELLRFLQQRASAMLIPWSFGKDLHVRFWDKTNFPSRLVEFSHLGLPIVIVAPSTTVLAKWARARQWKAYLDSPEPDALRSLLGRLRTTAGWQAMAAQSLRVAHAEFDAQEIQARFERELALGPFGHLAAQ